LSILDGQSIFSYDGLIRIEKDAVHSDASQTNRNILLSENARAIASPRLEIFESDVTARHASATGTTNEDALFFVESHGITPCAARKVLAEGAIRNFFDEMRKYTNDPVVQKLEEEAIQMLFSHRELTPSTKRKKLTKGRTR
jgi:Fe-S cluster assembly protein SufD